MRATIGITSIKFIRTTRVRAMNDSIISRTQFKEENIRPLYINYVYIIIVLTVRIIAIKLSLFSLSLIVYSKLVIYECSDNVIKYWHVHQ